MPTAFSLDHLGRRIELVPESSWQGDRVHLLVDGEHVAAAKSDGRNTVVAAGGIVVRAVVPWHGMSIASAELVRDDGEPLPLAPAPGSRAARRAQLQRERPGLYAARHVAKGVGKALLALIGIAFLFKFLPAIPWPSLDLPELPLPSIGLPDLPLPSIDLPSFELPGWIKAILLTKAIWLPVLIGIVLALREWRKRRSRDHGSEPTQQA